MRFIALASALLVATAAFMVATASILHADGSGVQKAGCYFLVARDDMSDPTFQQNKDALVAAINTWVGAISTIRPASITAILSASPATRSRSCEITM